MEQFLFLIKKSFLLGAFLLLSVGGSFNLLAKNEQGQKVEMYKVTSQGVGPSIGYVILSDSLRGLKISPHLKDLTPGTHGFHVHENPSCQPAEKDGKTVPAGAAGGHYDPDKTGKHLGPHGPGHKGDLPHLTVNQKGETLSPVLAPHLTLADVQNRTLIIHEGGDTYSDTPKELGGGGIRVACGVIKEPK